MSSLIIRDERRLARNRRLLTWGTPLLGLLLLPYALPVEEDVGLRVLFKWRGAIDPPAEVVVIGIDEATETDLGASLDRQTYAEVIDVLARAGASVIALDVFFIDETEQDERLAQAIDEAGNVILAELINRPLQRGLDLQQVLSPTELLASRSMANAPWVIPEDFPVYDAFLRDPVSEQATMPVVAYQFYTNNDFPEQFSADMLYVNYYGPPRTIDTIAFQDVHSGQFDDQSVAGKVAFVGFAALRQEGQDQGDDDHPYPYSVSGFNLSGVEMAATTFANLLHDSDIQRPAVLVRALIVLSWAAVIVGCFCILRIPVAAALIAVLGLIYLTIATIAFRVNAYWLPLVIPASQILFASIVMTRIKQLADRVRLSNAVGEEAALTLMQGGETEHERHEVILYADEVNSKKRLLHDDPLTTHTATETKKRLATLWRQVQQNHSLGPHDPFDDACEGPVAAQHGRINHRAGDSMLAHWPVAPGGGEIELAEYVNAACRSALQIHSAIESYNNEHPGQERAVRIGLDRGDVRSRLHPSRGNQTWRMEGQAIHTAERLESLNKLFATSTLISGRIAKLADREVFQLNELGSFIFCDDKGDIIVETVDVHTLDWTASATDELLDFSARFASARASLRDGELREASRLFEAVRAPSPRLQKLVSQYSAWCRKSLDENDDRWRGIVMVTFSDKSQYLDRYV